MVLTAHLGILVILAGLEVLVIVLLIFHIIIIRGDFSVVNDLAACATATGDDVALVNGLQVGFIIVILLC